MLLTQSSPGRRQSRGAATARDLDRQLLPTQDKCGQLVGSRLARVSVDPHITVFFREDLVWRGLISGWPTQCLPTVQSGAISLCNIVFGGSGGDKGGGVQARGTISFE